MLAQSGEQCRKEVSRPVNPTHVPPHRPAPLQEQQGGPGPAGAAELGGDHASRLLELIIPAMSGPPAAPPPGLRSRARQGGRAGSTGWAVLTTIRYVESGGSVQSSARPAAALPAGSQSDILYHKISTPPDTTTARNTIWSCITAVSAMQCCRVQARMQVNKLRELNPNLLSLQLTF